MLVDVVGFFPWFIKYNFLTRVNRKVGVAGAGPVMEELEGQGEVIQAQAQGLGEASRANLGQTLISDTIY